MFCEHLRVYTMAFTVGSQWFSKAKFLVILSENIDECNFSDTIGDWHVHGTLSVPDWIRLPKIGVPSSNYVRRCNSLLQLVPSKMWSTGTIPGIKLVAIQPNHSLHGSQSCDETDEKCKTRATRHRPVHNDLNWWLTGLRLSPYCQAVSSVTFHENQPVSRQRARKWREQVATHGVTSVCHYASPHFNNNRLEFLCHQIYYLSMVRVWLGGFMNSMLDTLGRKITVWSYRREVSITARLASTLQRLSKTYWGGIS